MSRDPLKVRHPFFLPLWRRVATTGACLGWGAFELSMGNTLWAILFLGLGVYLLWEFFLQFDPANYAPPDDPDSRD